MRQNNLIGTISTLPPSYEISFDFKPTSFEYPDMRNILHLTNRKDRGLLGDRVQTVWLRLSGRLAVITDQDGVHRPDSNHDSRDSLSLNDWNAVRIRRFWSGTNFSYEISLNGAVYFSRTDMTNNNVFNNVKVYASSPWHDSAEGKIRNFKIRTNPDKNEGKL